MCIRSAHLRSGPRFGFRECVVPENIHTPPMKGFSGLNPPPLWKFLFGLILSFNKKFGLWNSPPLGISNDLRGGGMDIFWNHTICPHVYDYVEKADLGTRYQDPKRKLGVTKHFSELIELKFEQKLTLHSS